MIYTHLATAGGAVNANGDYSVTPGSFRYSAPIGIRCDIHRMIVSIRDAAGFQAESYGALVNGALSTGIRLYVRDASDNIIETLTPVAITTNAEWGSYCYDADLKSWGSGDEFLLVRWTFSKSGRPLSLRKGQYLEAYLNDDLTGLTDHRFLIQGQQTAG